MRKGILFLVISIGLVISVLLIIAVVIGYSNYTSGTQVENYSEGRAVYDSYMPISKDSISSVDGGVANTESHIRKTANLDILVKDLDTARSSADNLVKKYEGEIINTYDTGKDNDRFIQLQVKINTKDFDNILQEFLSLDGDVESVNTNTQDITTEYIDLESRLKNLRAVEEQLVNILKESKSVTDTLAVYKELSSIRGEIEIYEGQLRYLDNQTEYSYITVTFALNKEGLNISEDPWRPLGEFRVALNALVGVFKALGNILIWLLVFSPIILVPGAIVYFVTKKSKKA